MTNTISSTYGGYSASIQAKKGYAYAVIKIKEDGKSKNKWVSTGIKITSTKKLLKETLLNKLMDYVSKQQEQEAMKLTDKILFHNYLKTWIDDKEQLCKTNRMRLSTFEGYEVRVKKHFIPYFEKLNLAICDVKPAHIDDYIKSKISGGRCDKGKGGLSNRTINDHRTLLHQIFNDALNTELIVRNPVDKIKSMRVDKYDLSKRTVLINSQDISDFMNAIKDEYIGVRLAYTITLQYGLRRSETVGLKWNSVDFNNDVIHINHTVVATKELVASDTTKTKSSRRTIAMTEDIKKELLVLKEEQNKFRELFKSEYIESDYVFCHEDGTLMRPNFLTRHLSLILVKHNLPHMRFHDLRHSAASILYENGCDAKDIQNLLGHSEIATTMNLYTHTTNESMRRTSNKIENIFSSINLQN